MNALKVFLLTLVWCLPVVTPEAISAERKPNIVLLMADDLGYECLSCNGGESYSTPQLDKLAVNGARFTDCHAQPLCTPSRVKIMTGVGTARSYEDFGLLKAGSKTFGHMLQGAGYKTAVVGKWQLLGREANRIGRGTHPKDAGFDEYCLWQVERRDSRYWKPVIEQNGEVIKTTKDDYGPDIFGNYANEFMSRNKERPFFLYYPMALTHSPFEPTPANRGQEDINGQKAFAGMVSYCDDIVGRLVSHMKEIGIEDNTLFIFTGDNGTNRSITSILNGQPIQGGKGTTLDSGTRVPLIASWPGTVKPSVCRDLVDFSDILPTLAEISGGTHPYAEQAEGRSFLPQLKGHPGDPRRWIYCYYQPYPQKNAAKRFARNQTHKLYDDGKLFDVKADPL